LCKINFRIIFIVKIAFDFSGSCDLAFDSVYSVLLTTQNQPAMYIEQIHLLIAGLVIVILALSFGIWLLFRAMRALRNSHNGGSDVLVDHGGSGGILQFVVGVAVVILILWFLSDPSLHVSNLMERIEANPTGQSSPAPKPRQEASPDTYQVPDPATETTTDKTAPVDDSDLSELDGTTGAAPIEQAPPPPPTNHIYKDVTDSNDIDEEASASQVAFFIVPVGCFDSPDKAFENLKGPKSLHLKVYLTDVGCNKVGYGPFENEQDAIDFRRENGSRYALKYKPERYFYSSP